MLHWNPAGSLVCEGGRQTVRANADLTAHPPYLLLIFNRAEMQRQTELWVLHTEHQHNSCSLFHTVVHTYVIVVVGLIVFMVDDQFFHSELLLLDQICLIDGALSQVHRQMPDVGMLTEENTQRRYIPSWVISLLHAHVSIVAEENIFSVCVVSPIREAVSSCDNPAWCNESATAKEIAALMRDSRNPRLWPYGDDGTTNNSMRRLLRPLATCQLCRDTQRVSGCCWRTSEDVIVRKSGSNTWIHIRRRFHCCRTCTETWYQYHHKNSNQGIKSKNLQSQTYIWESHRILVHNASLFWHDTMA